MPFYLKNLPHPALFLAPMEGVTNALFRNLIIACGSVDVVATEFVRITGEKQKVRPFERHEEHGVPLQIQFMAGDAKIIAGNICFLKQRGVLQEDDWIDLNVGCPSRRVNAHGAGAALLRTPKKVLEIISAMREVHAGVLSLKTRLGFETSADFPRLLAVLQKAPIDFLTLHARSRCGGYDEPISLEHLRLACKELPFPVIGNGDIWTVDDALRMLETGVRGLMCGRGVLRNPFLFAEIRSDVEGRNFLPTRKDLEQFIHSVISSYEQAERAQERRSLAPAFKELATWFSKNPLVGKEYFQEIRKEQHLHGIAGRTKDYFASVMPLVSASLVSAPLVSASLVSVPLV